MRSRGTKVAVAALALAALAVAVFWPVTDAGFLHYDDEEYVTANPRVMAGLTAEGVRWAFHTTMKGLAHPLTWLSLMLDVSLFGPDPARMHQVNIALHAANGVLLLLLLRALTGAVWSSALVAALFLVHPLHVESVAWISERKDVLSGLFWLLGIAAYLRYARRPRPRRLLAVWLLFALGLMAKPMLVTFPLTLLLLDYWPLGRLRDAAATWVCVREKVPFLALAVAAAALAVVAQSRAGALGGFEAFPPAVRAGNVLLSYGWYLGKAVWPARLAYYYPHPGAALSWGRAALTALLLAGLTGGAFALRRRAPHLLTGWAWYLVTLLPVIGIVQVGQQATADRYSYFPLIGVFLVVAWSARRAARRPSLRAVTAVAAVMWVASLAAAARVQAGHWRDSRSLASHAARVAPSWVAFLDLGITAQLEGSSDEALERLHRARDLDPLNPQVLYNLGWVHEQRREWFEALDFYRRAAARAPRDASNTTALGALLIALGSYREAVPWLEAALRSAPENDRAHSLLGGALLRLGERQRAEPHLTAAVRLNPRDVEARIDLAELALDEGRPDAALAHLGEALRLDPANRLAQALLARARPAARR